MKQFIARFEKQIHGTLSGFDRVMFRGSLRRLTHPQGMKMYLIQNGILCKQYQDHVKQVSQELKEASLAPFRQQQLLVQHVYDPKADKDAIAGAVASERGIREGNVCALTAMELSPTFQHEKTTMAVRWRPNLAIYHYQIDPQFGWMHARIQTWFPFYVHVCINGREWLARRLDHAGIRYSRQQNCFPWVEDCGRAQELFDEQLRVNWNESLQPFAERLNPLHSKIFDKFTTEYYWSSFQCEWATDILFHPGSLVRLEPLLLRHGLLNFSSADVLRFMGKQIGLTGSVPDWVAGEVTTSLKSRLVGDRLKHWIQGNSLKSYGKAHTPAGDVFRVETMTSNVRLFRTYRPAEGGPEDQLAWRPMRLGVADLHRRSEVSQKANNRYLDAFATVDDTTRFSELIRPLEQPCQYGDRRVRALRPFQPDDHRLLVTINRGEFAINGFRNRDLQPLLHAGSEPDLQSLSVLQRRRLSAAVSRKLRMLRAHGLIQKVPKTHRYQLTPTGRLAINAILTMHQTSLSLLTRAAA
jgi:hypothetical protein